MGDHRDKQEEITSFPDGLSTEKLRISGLDHVRNVRIKEIMDLDKTFIDRVEEKQLVWYGHLQRMSEERWTKTIWEWTPHGRRRRGRPRRTWSNNIKPWQPGTLMS
jgi:hypothetical protein